MIHQYDLVSFLCSYLHEMIQAQLGGNADQKGKGPALFALGETSSKRSLIKKSDVPWEPPPFGWLKVNVDGAYTKKHRKGWCWNYNPKSLWGSITVCLEGLA
jgi:hypothetical protein